MQQYALEELTKFDKEEPKPKDKGSANRPGPRTALTSLLMAEADCTDTLEFQTSSPQAGNQPGS